MGDKITLKLDERQAHGKKVKQLRRDGLVPGVVYGPGMEPVAVQSPDVVTNKVVNVAGKHAPVHLTIGSKRRIAMIKDVDFDPVKHTLRHVSFHAVNQNEPVEAEVPIRLTGEGESDAEKAGLVILQNLEHIEVKALPMDLPDALEVDITNLAEAGERVTVADIQLPDEVEIIDYLANQATEDDEESQTVMDLVIASVYEPSALAAANDAAGGDAEDEAEVESEHGEDTDQEAQSEESQPGGKSQEEPKQSNTDSNK